MLLYLVRHGQTDDNLRGIIQGHLDTPLNDHGRRESERLAEHLKGVAFTETWTSDLSRAREVRTRAVRVELMYPDCRDSSRTSRRVGGEAH